MIRSIFSRKIIIIWIIVLLLILSGCSTLDDFSSKIQQNDSEETNNKPSNQENYESDIEKASSENNQTDNEKSNEVSSKPDTNQNNNENNQPNKSESPQEDNVIPCSDAMESALIDIREINDKVASEQLQGEREEGYTSDELDQLISILRKWYNDSVSTKLTKAESDNTLIECAATELNNWEARLQLAGVEEYFTSEINSSYDSLAKGYNNAIDKAAKECANNHDLSKVNLMIYYHTNAMYRFGEEDERIYKTNEVYDKISKIARFELEFESRVQQYDEGEQIVSSIVKASNIVVELDSERFPVLVWKGQGSLDYIGFDMFDPELSYSMTGSDFKVLSLWIKLPNPEVSPCQCPCPCTQNNAEEQDNNQDGNVVMYIDPGIPKETIKSEGFSMTTNYWRGAFVILHENELKHNNYEPDSIPQEIKGMKVENWDLGGPGLKIFARKVYEPSIPGEQVNGTTDFILKHSPLY